MPSKLKKAIRAVKDQTSIGLARIARRSSPGSSTRLEVAVLKATSHDEVPMEDRHLTEVILLAASSPASAAAVAAAIRRRISRTRNWVVSLKCLSVAAAAISDSGPDFRPEAATLHILDLSLFSDNSSKSSPWDFTAFVRTYALYLDARLQSSLKGHIPPNNRRRLTISADMKPSLVLERIEHWQHILDRAIGTRPTGPAKINRLVQFTLYPIVQETYDLYRNVTKGLSLLLSKFFHLPYSSRVSTFEVCSKAAKQFEKLDDFYIFCRKIGIGRAVEYPDIQKISKHLLQTLEQFLKDYQDSDISARLQSPLKLLLDTRSPLANSDRGSMEGWEMVLAESTRQSSRKSDDRQKIFKMETPSPISPRSSKNPFLDDWSDTGFVASPSTMALSTSHVASPSTMALSTSRVASPSMMALSTSHVYQTRKEAAEELEITRKLESDPFAKSMAWVEKMDESARHKLIQEQQLWLQHQNKIIEKSLAW